MKRIVWRTVYDFLKFILDIQIDMNQRLSFDKMDNNVECKTTVNECFVDSCMTEKYAMEVMHADQATLTYRYFTMSSLITCGS